MTNINLYKGLISTQNSFFIGRRIVKIHIRRFLQLTYLCHSKSSIMTLHKSIIYVSICFLLACNANNGSRPETAMDTGREFIRASLDGNFDRAENLLLKDTLNMQLFSRYKDFYKTLQASEKKQYKDATYEINKYTDVNDSVTTINYSNSYMKKPMEIMLVRSNELWNVDFKYTYSGQDTDQ